LQLENKRWMNEMGAFINRMGVLRAKFCGRTLCSPSNGFARKTFSALTQSPLTQIQPLFDARAARNSQFLSPFAYLSSRDA